MIKNPAACLVILAGGQSTRMGTDKAVITFEGQRLIDILIGRFTDQAGRILLSAKQDYDSGLAIISDDPDAPAGPVGAIFSVAARLPAMQKGIEGFVTVPVDAPFAPEDLIDQLSASGSCAVAEDDQRIHPTFAYWRCDVVNAIRGTHEPGERAPSLQWLAQQCDAKIVTWSDQKLFLNINRPEDLVAAAAIKKAGA
ncbi:molybdenum cofactor guanylyltransferase [Parasphingorhabdus sp.]|uniref:molybdenum cofactor guanylyltransferase n=1 Tax=Parasphingorhabdus sp. TaxID=2709688 RepID=UPI0030B61714|nr:molybdenum cofactor guanylyltransferase [Sphingomonadales bacterium]